MNINQLSISYTNKCTAKCGHCGSSASPDNFDKLYPEEIIKCMPDFHNYGIRHVLYTGGEPVLYIDELAKISKEILKHQWKQTIFTNAYWAKNIKNANKIIDKFIMMGINTVMISSSDYHMKFIRYNCLKNAFDLLTENRINAALIATITNKNSFQFKSALIGLRKYSIFYNNLYPVGRGASLAEAKETKISGYDALKHKCDHMHHILLNYNGEIMRCNIAVSRQFKFNKYYSYGNIRKNKLSNILNKLDKHNKLFELLHKHGPGNLYSKLKDKINNNGYMLKENYFSHCELCGDLFGNKTNYNTIINNSNIEVN